jgi:hypothetical protein
MWCIELFVIDQRKSSKKYIKVAGTPLYLLTSSKQITSIITKKTTFFPQTSLFFFSKGKMHFSTTLLGLSALLTSTVLATPTGSTLLPQEDVETGYSVIAPSEIPKYITEGAAAYATKLNETAAAISKRQNVGVFFCVDKDFTGYCVHIVQPANTCSE